MVPTEQEIIDFLKKKDLVNLTMIAKFFDIKNMTASDLINDLQKKGLVKIKKLGGSKVVMIK